MATQRPTDPETPQSRPKAQRTGRATSLYLSPEIRAALDRYLAETRPAPTLTNTIETALEDFLRTVGYWPPPPAGA